MKTGALVGSSGDADDSDLVNLLNRLKGRLPTHKQLISLEFEFDAILVQPDKSVYTLESIRDETSGLYRSAVTPIKEPFVAVGSGASLALGALAMGATSEQAVKVAIKFNSSCGGQVQTLRLESI